MQNGRKRREHVDTGSGKDRLIAELRELVLARDEFVAVAAHELRNPMTPILMHVDLLLSAAKDPNRCRPEVMAPRLEMLKRATEDFIRRATVLLDVSRIASGNLQLKPAEIDLSHIVAHSVDGVEISARMARTSLQADVQQGVTGTWDAFAVEQVVENLLSNAIKFGAGQPVGITLRADEHAARLSVRDRGIGIAEKDRVRIFERFGRAVTQRESGGFGIGLWLSNQLVTAMGGAISVESLPGQGTTFTVTLPRTGMAEPQMSDI